MTGETDLDKLLRSMQPRLNDGEYVFCTISQLHQSLVDAAIFLFKEKEAVTIVLKKEQAENLGLTNSYVAAWITLTVHSSLEAVGLTAAFSSALAKQNISCNVVAAYYHDHIFLAKKRCR